MGLFYSHNQFVGHSGELCTVRYTITGINNHTASGSIHFFISYSSDNSLVNTIYN